MAPVEEGWEERYEGNPLIFSVGCVGRLASNANSLADGRSNILLQGLGALRNQEEFLIKVIAKPAYL